MPLIVALATTVGTIVIHSLALTAIVYLIRHELRLGRIGVRFRNDVAIIAAAALVALAAHLIEIVVWALVFGVCGEFPHFGRALYHSAMCYTTVGDSGIAMSPSWTLLAPLEAADGMLMFGVSTAAIFAVIQRVVQTKFGTASTQA